MDDAGRAPDREQRYAEAAAAFGPALERLLFDDKAEHEMLMGARRERRCAVGQAIAWNVVMIAHEVRLGWTSDIVEAIAKPDKAKEATSRIATDFLAFFAFCSARRSPLARSRM